MIENIIENFRKFGSKSVYTIMGISKKFKMLKHIKTIKNNNWNNTNIVGSLLCADKILSKHETLISYADIYYDKEALKLLTQVKKKLYSFIEL